MNSTVRGMSQAALMDRSRSEGLTLHEAPAVARENQHG